MNDERAKQDARAAVHSVRRSEAEANARGRIAERDAQSAIRAETPEGIAEEVAARIFRTGTARRSEIDRTVDKLNLS